MEQDFHKKGRAQSLQPNLPPVPRNNHYAVGANRLDRKMKISGGQEFEMGKRQFNSNSDVTAQKISLRGQCPNNDVRLLANLLLFM
jgi:hypothetical protein